MDLESFEEFPSGSNDHVQMIKGRRTKRQRPSSPFGMAVTCSSSGGYGGGGGGGGGDSCYSSIPSPITSDGISESTEEDEDMANCLILLAQGGCTGTPPKQGEEIKSEKSTSRRFAEMATTTAGKAGFYVYQCKTCNRTFPSFQALGGHRASHKKPKPTAEEKKPGAFTTPAGEEERQFQKSSHSLSFPIVNKDSHGNNNPKIHECSICGSEFSSGQALGGHMRRHRTPTPTTRITMSMGTSTAETSSNDGGEKPRNILPLDLNLPAPEDDLRETKFPLTGNQPHLVFSAPTLVDCHY